MLQGFRYPNGCITCNSQLELYALQHWGNFLSLNPVPVILLVKIILEDSFFIQNFFNITSFFFLHFLSFTKLKTTVFERHYNSKYTLHLSLLISSYISKIFLICGMLFLIPRPWHEDSFSCYFFLVFVFLRGMFPSSC